MLAPGFTPAHESDRGSAAERKEGNTEKVSSQVGLSLTVYFVRQAVFRASPTGWRLSAMANMLALLLATLRNRLWRRVAAGCPVGGAALTPWCGSSRFG
jgi:hypothetical protein